MFNCHENKLTMKKYIIVLRAEDVRKRMFSVSFMDCDRLVNFANTPTFAV